GRTQSATGPPETEDQSEDNYRIRPLPRRGLRDDTSGPEAADRLDENRQPVDATDQLQRESRVVLQGQVGVLQEAGLGQGDDRALLHRRRNDHGTPVRVSDDVDPLEAFSAGPPAAFVTGQQANRPEREAGGSGID